MTPDARNLLLGAGQVFFDRFDASGNRTGLRHLGNVPKLNLNQTVDKISKKQSMHAAKTTYLEVVREITAKADVTLEEFVPENLSMALLGAEGTITQTATEVTDEPHTAYPGKYLQLNAIDIASVASIEPSPTGTAYIAGTDYVVEATLLRAGLILIPETSAIVKGAKVLVTYTPKAGTYPTVAGATAGSVEGYMFFAGDPTKGPAYNVDFWHVTITPNGDLALIGEELAAFDITIGVMDDRSNHPNEPLYRLVKMN